MSLVDVHLVRPPLAPVLEPRTKQQTLANKGGVEVVVVWCREELVFLMTEVSTGEVRYTNGWKRPLLGFAQEISIADTHRLLTGCLKPLSGARIQMVNAEVVTNRSTFAQVVNGAVKLIVNDA